MGLDTVELAMEIEKFFGIRIQDFEAEQISTLQDTVSCVAAHRRIYATTTLLHDLMLKRMRSILALPDGRHLQAEDPVSPVLVPGDRVRWQQVAQELQLQVPFPAHTGATPSLRRKLTTFMYAAPGYTWPEITWGHFIDTICAVNYKQLVSSNALSDQYDVYIAIAGITHDCTGADPYEIRPHKSYTNDLGMS